jgi:hypothetical protein
LCSYGAFPSTSTWYVAAGQWPGEGNDNTGSTTTGGSTTSGVVKRVSARADIVHTAEGYRYAFNQPTQSLGARGLQGNTSNDYIAQIVKTTDGGNTWTSVFTQYNYAYLNGIDCLDENRCCVAAENDDTNGFASILCTFDGGANWNQTYYNNATGASLLDLRVVGTDGYWAVGGEESEVGSAAGFLYSADAGMTWTLDTVISGQYATSVDVSCTALVYLT